MVVFVKDSNDKNIATDGNGIYLIKSGGVYVPNYPKGSNGYALSLNWIMGNSDKMPAPTKRPIRRKCA